MIIRMQFIGAGTRDDPFHPDLPNFTNVSEAVVFGRGFVDVPASDVSPDVAAFVTAYPTVDLTTPLPVPFPPALASSWAEFLARRYDLGSAKWHPAVF